jgi:hypothetical protein
VHGVGVGAASCVTVKVWPARVMVPVRTPPALVATLNVTEPLPVPLAPEMTVIHGTPLLAVQVQPMPVDTGTVEIPPDAGIDTSGGRPTM